MGNVAPPINGCLPPNRYTSESVPWSLVQCRTNLAGKAQGGGGGGAGTNASETGQMQERKDAQARTGETEL